MFSTREAKCFLYAFRQSLEADAKIEYTKGLILKLSTDDTTLTREDIKTEVMKYGKAAFVDFYSGSTEGYIRMQSPEMSHAVANAMKNGNVKASPSSDEAAPAEAPAAESEADGVTAPSAPLASGVDVEGKARFTVVVLDGDEEDSYWRKIKAHQKALFRSRARGVGHGHRK